MSKTMSVTRRHWRPLAATSVLVIFLAVVIALAGCGAKHSSVPPAAKASARATASQVITGIRTGQAARQAEGIVRGCAAKFSGIPLIRCIAPKAPKGAHRKAFDKCAIKAMGQDIPGQEVRFVQTDLPNCLVANR